MRTIRYRYFGDGEKTISTHQGNVYYGLNGMDYLFRREYHVRVIFSVARFLTYKSLERRFTAPCEVIRIHRCDLRELGLFARLSEERTGM